MIYLDNSATTRPFMEVVDSYTKASLTFFGNPSSLHRMGTESEQLLLKTKEQIAGILGISSSEIIYTSGGTEGNNLAIKGTAYQLKGRGTHLITTAVEHASTIEAFRSLEAEGFKVTYLKPGPTGQVTAEQVKAALTNQTILVSIIHVNNETGIIMPVEGIGELLKGYPKVRFHIDHVQGATKVPLRLAHGLIDLVTFSSHKFHGLKGTGFIYKKDGLRLTPLFHGGGQEGALRSGTENVAGAVATAKALRMAMELYEERHDKLLHLRNQLLEGLSEIEGVVINTPKELAAPHIVNFSIPKMKPEVIIQALSKRNIHVSTKSACSTKRSEPSHVLLAMGVGKERANSAIRLSLSYLTTEDEVSKALQELQHLIPELLEVVQ
ncbi:cysteine desulfurase family protein [Halalkalibacterium halodurans]|uniref:cysteine desulfurase family protein n=1 Tax=Halalkalibacterium halodurans TaxID=86665 RepID=UPI002AAA11F7|nr:cysteine desulfurase family protein [Halalkalibacterium halodurans]MDY7223737.1 cysteine desulfurase family protein [Halalkalibacterium halodurans]MDY7242958.1 cysteine desulfurase family protein [Halalkalibacterium halodurans]